MALKKWVKPQTHLNYILTISRDTLKTETWQSLFTSYVSIFTLLHKYLVVANFTTCIWASMCLCIYRYLALYTSRKAFWKIRLLFIDSRYWPKYRLDFYSASGAYSKYLEDKPSSRSVKSSDDKDNLKCWNPNLMKAFELFWQEAGKTEGKVSEEDYFHGSCD